MMPPDWLFGDVTAPPMGKVTVGGGGLLSTAWQQ